MGGGRRGWRGGDGFEESSVQKMACVVFMVEDLETGRGSRHVDFRNLLDLPEGGSPFLYNVYICVAGITSQR
jgi:hypothetical protein